MSSKPSKDSLAPSERSSLPSLSIGGSLRQPSDDLRSYRSSVAVSKSWKLKSRVKPPGGGVLELYTKADDNKSYMYVLETPSGGHVSLCRYLDNCTIYAYDASSGRTRYITNSS